MFFAFVKLTCYDYNVNRVQGSAIRMMSPKTPAKAPAANSKSSVQSLAKAFRALGHRDLRTLARPLLRSLVGEVSEAASLGVLNGADVLYVERMRAGITRL